MAITKAPALVYRWTGFLLHKVHELARELYTIRMDEMSLRPYQVGILQLLAAEGPLVQARIADKLAIDKAGLVQNLNELEQASLVERKNHPDDDRSFIVHLTPLGRERLRLAEESTVTVSDELFKALSRAEREALRALLTKFFSLTCKTSGMSNKCRSRTIGTITLPAARRHCVTTI